MATGFSSPAQRPLESILIEPCASSPIKPVLPYLPTSLVSWASSSPSSLRAERAVSHALNMQEALQRGRGLQPSFLCGVVRHGSRALSAEIFTHAEIFSPRTEQHHPGPRPERLNSRPLAVANRSRSAQLRPHSTVAGAITVASPRFDTEASSLPTLTAAVDELRKDLQHERERREAQDRFLEEFHRNFRLSVTLRKNSASQTSRQRSRISRRSAHLSSPILSTRCSS